MKKADVVVACLSLAAAASRATGDVLVEAESFNDKGGWKVDQQFIDSMGSPYLLAHGMGVPVANAKTSVTFPDTGIYHLWVRTKNWVPGEWEPPGRFKVVINGTTLDTVFGTVAGWTWQAGGTVTILLKETTIELKDLTGFEGRCDALFFSKNAKPDLPNDLKGMKKWRDTLAGLPEHPPSAGTFDVVIVGGGIAGCAAALAADRQGIKIALIHDRPILGGNASAEVRVHSEGIPGKSPDIISQLNTKAWPNGSELAELDDTKRHESISRTRGTTLFLGWRAYAANTDGNRITSVEAKNIETGKILRFEAPIFIDCTGDGWIGYWAGAEYRYGRESKNEFNEGWAEKGALWSPEQADNWTMGSSVLWGSEDAHQPVAFPDVPWAMPVAKDNKATSGEWTWEYASPDLNQISDAEQIRDHMFRAIYGSWSNAKKNPANANKRLKWVAYIAGKRESRRLMGDHIYSLQDAKSNTVFADTVVEDKRNVDVHYQEVVKNGKSPDFMSEALYLEIGTYYVPFRCLYSRNIKNLMMAGRCFSCTHIGLGGPRCMNTTGQMGVATGYAAALCAKHKTTPRGIYKHHITELRKLIGYQK